MFETESVATCSGPSSAPDVDDPHNFTSDLIATSWLTGRQRQFARACVELCNLERRHGELRLVHRGVGFGHRFRTHVSQPGGGGSRPGSCIRPSGHHPGRLRGNHADNVASVASRISR